LSLHPFDKNRAFDMARFNLEKKYDANFRRQSIALEVIPGPLLIFKKRNRRGAIALRQKIRKEPSADVMDMSEICKTFVNEPEDILCGAALVFPSPHSEARFCSRLAGGAGSVANCQTGKMRGRKMIEHQSTTQKFTSAFRRRREK